VLQLVMPYVRYLDPRGWGAMVMVVLLTGGGVAEDGSAGHQHMQHTHTYTQFATDTWPEQATVQNTCIWLTRVFVCAVAPCAQALYAAEEKVKEVQREARAAEQGLNSAQDDINSARDSVSRAVGVPGRCQTAMWQAPPWLWVWVLSLGWEAGGQACQ